MNKINYLSQKRIYKALLTCSILLVSIGSGIASFEDANWLSLTRSLSDSDGCVGYIKAIAISSNGTVYVGGKFDEINGVRAKNIAMWNGINWSALGRGIRNGSDNYAVVEALVLDAQGRLYAGGSFEFAGEVRTNSIAMWNGSSWNPLGSGLEEYAICHDLCFDTNNNLFAAGNFWTAGGVDAVGIAKWNGSTWSRVGSLAEINNQILQGLTSIVFDNSGNLFAGGYNGVAK